MKTILTSVALLALLAFPGRAQDAANPTTNAPAAPATSAAGEKVVTLADTNALATPKSDTTVSTSANATATTPALQRAGYTDGRFEAGLVLGEPTGASLKYWLNDRMAVDGALGWSFDDESDLHLQSDVLWHRFDAFHVSEGELPLYFGVGARVKFRDNADDRIGIRVPVGVSYLFEDVPVDVFFEVAPVIDVSPTVRGGFTVGIGARYRF